MQPLELRRDGPCIWQGALSKDYEGKIGTPGFVERIHGQGKVP